MSEQTLQTEWEDIGFAKEDASKISEQFKVSPKSASDITEIDCKEAGLSFAGRVLMRKLREREEKSTYESNDKFRFKLPRNLPKFKHGDNIVEFLDQVQFIMESKHIPLNKWHRVMLGCLSVHDGRRLVGANLKDTKWHEARKVLRKVLVPKTTKASLMKEVYSMKPNGGELMRNYCYRFRTAVVEAELEQGKDTVELFFDSFPPAIREIVHQKRCEFGKNELKEIDTLDKAIKFMILLWSNKSNPLVEGYSKDKGGKDSRGGDKGKGSRGNDKGKDSRGDKGKDSRSDKGKDSRGDKGKDSRSDKKDSRGGDKGKDSWGDNKSRNGNGNGNGISLNLHSKL